MKMSELKIIVWDIICDEMPEQFNRAMLHERLPMYGKQLDNAIDALLKEKSITMPMKGLFIATPR